MSARSWATTAVGLLLWLCCTASGQTGTVRFQQPLYSVFENGGSAQVCVVVEVIEPTEGSVSVRVDAINMTAIGGKPQ